MKLNTVLTLTVLVAIMGFMGYPEILLALVCFLFLRHLNRNNGVLMNWPLFGMLPSLLINVHRIHDWSTKLLARNGCSFVFRGPWFTNMNYVVCTSDQADVRYIMNTNFSNFPKGSEFKEMFDILGDGIFNSDSDLWRTQRKIAHGLINHRRFRRFLEKTIWEKVENGLIPVLEHVTEQGLVVDLQDVFQRLTFDSTCILVSGIDPSCLSVEFPKVPFTEALDIAEETILYRHFVPESCWKFQRWLGIGMEKKLSKAWETLDHFVAQCISTKRQQLSKRLPKNMEEEESIDLLTSYMQEQEIGESKSDSFLRDTLLNFLIAGRDTVSAALTWFFWLVSRNPSVETKILEELTAKKWRKFGMEGLSGLLYLHGALCETLRLFPSVPFEHKSPLRPDILPSGHTVNTKERILLSLYAMGRMEAIWGEDCLEFKPERWISERGGIKYEPSYKFSAFNSGPRICLGKEVAFTQMKSVAATLLYDYHVELVEGHPVAPKNSIILHMKHGLMARIKRREV